ncbi:M16 family metallopeptidase [Rhodopirellula halodulae]|uniref:M16 family metallopeptidase n=1 Tax=Rhodopirellula halodulae TaxID=2894198 RepID=UPI001E603E6E|nr:pitrilysin family protein [Rhodopirellula sp. JC737]MCC9656826.1 insulinase family protein [Rhodopirellula sp. JC737]
MNQSIPQNLRSATLSNGLRVVADIDQRGYSAAVGYFVRAGARDETDIESGLSHFLEHMMFKGTARRSAADVNRELDELGGQSNAYTSEEQTVYYSAVLPKYQDRMIDLLTDMLSPTLDEGEFATERNVILEEIAKYEDQPPFGAFERVMECAYGPRGLGRRVLGTTHSIESMRVETMRAYFNRRYRPDNIVLAASGNVDFDGLVAQAEKMTTHWQDRPLPSNLLSDDPSTSPEGIDLTPQLRVPDAAQSYRVTLGDGPSMQSELRYAMRLLCSIVGDDGGSRLFWDLIDTGRAEVATLWPQEFTDTGALFTYLVCAADDMPSNIRLMNDVLQRVASDGVDQAELDQVINKTVAGCIMQSERPSNRLFGLGSRWLCCGDYLSLDELLDAYRGVTIEKVAKAAQTYLNQSSTEVIASSVEPPSPVAG